MKLEGRPRAEPTDRFVIVAARFNELVGEALVDGARRALEEAGAAEPIVVWVPGALEIAGAARRLVTAGTPIAGIIAVGAVIRGETDHYEVVATQASAQLARLAAEATVPVANALLTVDSLEQAFDRAGAKHGNKGYEAALVAVRMADVYRRIDALKEDDGSC
ncbi:6,7-dimethyl-8-ribityllumazine synthase [Acidimicrobium ferrooxidans DSM 10331]|uniref:6,7-dimethyl-8-ribityllumazine synthase n=1 Tax=Acidimicrobium ferrooxidans (strain DSM 10331 / JCM 15462 / NBRC 103882 / ICP) TaxID=525909 RepID=C7M0U0_ACIFD|nr:6,7-dimethyl-8-ribityllumazine synthase [Acidimicrobium ferrooxidans]ACU54598.1 6,7-dimethyl-8-ribityllumazine synthase [Acidimicrobium ferrooxidans DSM 10331]